ncbi:MAG: 4Fe-4S dicluster domain-containing protein [Candidatus Lokiarchaeota archaeon]|nr:4Fe-4S dicluster domain-containing protein [Candidatus Lokiarchaeota archaeon]
MSVKQNQWNLFDTEACTRCGECFHKCPEMSLPLEIAKQEINALIDGQDSKHVLYHCTTCFSCNLICPHDCKPYELILQRWNELYWKRGAPPIYRFVCPTMESNIWQMLEVLMPEDEKVEVQKWMNQDLKEEVLLIGNYTHLFSFIIGNSKLLDYFTPVDLLDQWECGAYLYQGGYLDVVKEIGKNCKSTFDSHGVKTVVPFLDAVQYMIDTIHSKEMDVKFNQKIINFNKWILDKIENGDLIFQKKLDFKVTIHDNCYSKADGGLYWNTARDLIKKTGCEIIEMEHIKENALCCGFGAGASWKNKNRIVFDILAGAKRKYEEAEATGADAIVTYCGGCLYLLWAANELFSSNLKVFHSIELVRMALGEKIDINQKMHKKRAWDIITIISYHIFKGLSKDPFRIEDLEFTEEKWKQKKFRFLRFMRWCFRSRVIQFLFRKIFGFLLPRMKTKREWENDGE